MDALQFEMLQDVVSLFTNEAYFFNLLSAYVHYLSLNSFFHFQFLIAFSVMIIKVSLLIK